MTHLPAVPASPWGAPGSVAAPELDRPALLLCDEHAKVLLMNDAAQLALAAGEVLSLRTDASLSVRSHGAGLLALRSAVRAAARDGLAQSLLLRHGPAVLQVSVAPLLGHDNHWPCALLALGQGAGATPRSLADLLAGWQDKPLAQTAGL